MDEQKATDTSSPGSQEETGTPKGKAAKKASLAAVSRDATREPILDQEPQPPQASQALQQAQTQPDAQADQDPKPFDFGGMPDRNLKKNLGCG